MMRRHHIKYISQLGHNTKSIPSLLKVSKSLFQIVLSSLSPLPLSHSLFHHTFKGKRHISGFRQAALVLPWIFSSLLLQILMSFGAVGSGDHLSVK
ncbi:hypothetical protein POTOM_008651 [Populus tomentosa]|uniref:Uncharacterized protein n=1 Tax=Populus tomentosa TaxID=118781 RepID=A0A8X8DEA9_POPTO|nr:hypothetical protein POTOM_008651 [Populus tomentosa]